MTSTPSMRPRILAFALVAVGCAVGIAGYARHVILHSRTPPQAAAASAATPAAPRPPAPATGLPAARAVAAAPVVASATAVQAAASAASAARASLLFRGTALGDDYGHVMRAWLDDPDGAREVAPLVCDRVHVAAGSGVCLAAERGALTVYRAQLFDAHYAVRRTIDLAGPPSRARISPDGRKAAFTVFISGQGYAATFTTRTSIVDAFTGDSIVDDLEAWPVMRGDGPFKEIDFNFWGVTFAPDGRHFYATLGTGGKTFLVEGDFASRQMHVVAPDVECPSLSPDGRRIGFKRRDTANADGRLVWHVAVLDLASGQVRVLPGETRSVDDQVEWNGNDELLYAMPLDSRQSSAEQDVWALRIDGKSPPRRLARYAFSPAVVR